MIDVQGAESDVETARHVFPHFLTIRSWFDRPMRILIVSDAWTPQINGVVRTYQRTTRELADLGHVAEVIGPDRFNTIPCPTYPEIRLAIDAWYRLAGMIRSFDPDAIHIATEGPLGSAARRFCLKNDIPFTSSFHTRFPEYVEARCGFPARHTYAWMRRFHAPSQAVMVPTESMRQALIDHGFTNTRIWGRGVDTNIFKPEADQTNRDFLGLPRPIYTYVGRVAVEKNIGQFLDLDLQGTKLVVGDGPMLAALRAKHPDVVFVGAKEGEELVRHYQASDVFVFPSRTDTFGLVLIEALACGVPVAALPVTGPIDVVADGKVGFLDIDLAQAARSALAVSRDACRDYALGFSWERAVGQFLEGLFPFHPVEKFPLKPAEKLSS